MITPDLSPELREKLEEYRRREVERVERNKIEMRKNNPHDQPVRDCCYPTIMLSELIPHLVQVMEQEGDIPVYSFNWEYQEIVGMNKSLMAILEDGEGKYFVMGLDETPKNI